MIGLVCFKKAQDIFIKAVELLDDREKRNVQFWIIGFIGDDEYSNQVKELASKDTAIKIVGRLMRSEIYEAYKEIDVLVCPSLEDSLPITATESMMYGKACIVSDATGTSHYIKNGENGFICKKGEPRDLCEKMRWIIQNQEKLPMLGFNARQTYERYFSLDKFGIRLETALQDTVDNWRK